MNKMLKVLFFSLAVFSTALTVNALADSTGMSSGHGGVSSNASDSSSYSSGTRTSASASAGYSGEENTSSRRWYNPFSWFRRG